MLEKIQRPLLIIGVLMTGYLLVLQWDADYGGGSQVPTSSIEDSQRAPAGTAAPETPLFEVPSDEFENPTLDSSQLGLSSPQGAPVNSQNLLRLESDKLILLVERRGGDIIGAELRDYREQLGAEQPLLLLRNDQQRLAIAQSGLIGRDGFDSRAAGRPLYSSAQNTYSLAAGQDTLRVPLTFSEAGVEVVKTFVLQRGRHDLDIEFAVENNGAEPWQAQIFALFKRDSQEPTYERAAFGTQSFTGAAFTSESDSYRKVSFRDMGRREVSQTTRGGWAAMVQHYFVAAFIPQAMEREYYYSARQVAADEYIFGLGGQNFVVPAGQSYTDSLKLYLGPKTQTALEALAPNLVLTIDYGWLWYLSQPLFRFMDFIHNYVPNWGLAIIILTFIIKLVFFPLTNASYKSMARMRALQPQMEQLRQNYASDRQRMQKEVMELYKREKVNPVGGCLPILIQMPIFIAFYWALIESVELRHAPLIWWIQDLSARDQYFVLPLLMGVSMFVQQLLSPKPPDPMQARIMKLLPVIFTVFFLWFPAGLVLYWVVNNILSIVQQYMINKRLGTLEPLSINLNPLKKARPAAGSEDKGPALTAKAETSLEQPETRAAAKPPKPYKPKKAN